MMIKFKEIGKKRIERNRVKSKPKKKVEEVIKVDVRKAFGVDQSIFKDKKMWKENTRVTDPTYKE